MAEAIPDNSNAKPSNPSTSAFNYPWAAAPDIIRANQKDAHFQSVLLTHLSSVIRALYGTRTEHRWSSEASVFTELLYLALTTLVGNRTLGEEYCDVVQVCADTHTLPSLAQRSGYILSAVLVPWAVGRALPALRRRLRAKLERTLARTQRRRASSPSRGNKQRLPPDRATLVQAYVLQHLDSLTSPAPLYAVGLAVFYFRGAYYQLSKRVWRLRYVFTRALDASDARAGYEVLGVLLVVQMAVQAYLHLRQTYEHHTRESALTEAHDNANTPSTAGDALPPAENHFAAPLLFDPPTTHGSADPAVIRRRVERMTHTPRPGVDARSQQRAEDEGEDMSEDQPRYRYHLADDAPMRWMGESAQSRKCTLCLDPLRDPAVTPCGHVFCWSCATDWLREQPLCPLCRQPALVQHVLPLRG